MTKAQKFIDCMRLFRVIATQRGLTAEELVVLSAQFTGLAVADCQLSVEGDAKTLDIAARAMATACMSKRATREGFGRPVAPTTAETNASNIVDINKGRLA